MKWVGPHERKNPPPSRLASASASDGVLGVSAAERQDWDQDPSERSVPFFNQTSRRLQRGCYRLDDDVYETFLSSSKGGSRHHDEGRKPSVAAFGPG